MWRAVKSFASGWFRLDCDLSVLSGLTTRVSIGVPVEEVEIAIDFGSSRSTFYRESSCPAFVSCHTTLAFFASSERTVLYETLWMGGGYGYVDFRVRFARPPNSAMFRDVAGTLAAGPDSDIFSNRIIEIRQTRLSGISLNQTSRRPEEAEWVPSSSKSSWELTGIILNELVTISFKMTAGTDILVLPLSMKSLFGDREDSVTSSVPIRFGSIELTMKPKRIIFSSEADECISVGPLLLSSSERIILDYGERQIGLIPRKDEQRILVPVMCESLNLFRVPRMDEARKEIVISPQCTLEDSLVLKSEDPEDGTDTDGSSQECWTLYPVSPHSCVRGESVSVKGNFNHMGLTQTREGLVWRLISNSNYQETVVTKYHIEYLSDSVRVCAVVEKDLSSFDLPGPVRGCEEDLCAICFDLMGSDDLVQQLRSCKHQFHSKCARRWINTKALCPTCRAQVQHKQLWGCNIS